MTVIHGASVHESGVAVPALLLSITDSGDLVWVTVVTGARADVVLRVAGTGNGIAAVTVGSIALQGRGGYTTAGATPT